MFFHSTGWSKKWGKCCNVFECFSFTGGATLFAALMKIKLTECIQELEMLDMCEKSNKLYHFKDMTKRPIKVASAFWPTCTQCANLRQHLAEVHQKTDVIVTAPSRPSTVITATGTDRAGSTTTLGPLWRSAVLWTVWSMSKRRPITVTVRVITIVHTHVTVLKAVETTYVTVSITSINPLESRGSYSATSNNMKLVHWPLMGRLLHLVQPQPAQSPPRSTKCNSPPIDGECTNHRINNNNNDDNVYGGVIMAEPLREFTQFIWWM